MHYWTKLQSQNVFYTSWDPQHVYGSFESAYSEERKKTKINVYPAYAFLSIKNMEPSKNSKVEKSTKSNASLCGCETASALTTSRWPEPDPKFSTGRQYHIKVKSSYLSTMRTLKQRFPRSSTVTYSRRSQATLASCATLLQTSVLYRNEYKSYFRLLKHLSVARRFQALLQSATFSQSLCHSPFQRASIPNNLENL